MPKEKADLVLGARSLATVDSNFLALLDAGVTQSRTHVEQMAMSATALLDRAFPELSIDRDQLTAASFIDRLRMVGYALHKSGGPEWQRVEACWISDTIRGWCAMAIGADDQRSLEEILTDLRPYAGDGHFAVREWAWLAVRPHVAREPQRALAALDNFFASADPFERRFAVELTRPISVWGEHIALFKRTPELAEPALDLLRCDPNSYVRRAVGNWLNDASKSRPDWVGAVRDRWGAECDCPATLMIVRRGTRTIRTRS